MIVLGIETSCDETAAAVVTDESEGANPEILANIVLSQDKLHEPYGGIVPEIAARAHLQEVDGVIKRVMESAGLRYSDLDGVAATGGPGLIGGVIVGVMSAKAVAAVHNLPFVAVNHLEGHALTVRLTESLPYPYLLLLVSGGHCQLLEIGAVGEYHRRGTTIDDAIGESFDKVAKLLGLGYPGGPALERAARGGNIERFNFPRPMIRRAGCDFSFSGLKTSVRQTVERLSQPLCSVDIADVAAGFQAAVADILVDRTRNALESYCAYHDDPIRLVVAGGVAANRYLRDAIENLCVDTGAELSCPPIELCTDNAAMIGWAGIERLQQGWADPLDFAPRPRWPLDPEAPPAVGAGVKA